MKSQDDIAYYELATGAGQRTRRGFDLLHPRELSISAPATGSPHRHEYQEIILVEGGTGIHTVDGMPSALLPGTAALIGKGRVHLFLDAAGFTAWIVRFTDDFLPPDGHGWETETVQGLFDPLGPGQSLSLPKPERDQLHQLLMLMEREHARPDGQPGDRILRHLLAVLLLRLGRYRIEQPGDQRLALPEYRVYRDFLIQLEAGFRTRHGVAYYADALNVGPDRLSRALQRAVGKTAKQLVAERIVLEAKRLLTYTSLSIKEIAQSLGFNDQFRFSKVFKGQTGLPPQAFREEWRKGT